MSMLCILSLATAIVIASTRNVNVDSDGSSCKAHVADIGFIVDSSYSIGGDTGTGDRGKAWQQELEFVKSLASRIGISDDGVHLSLIAFSEWASLTIKFNAFTDVGKFNDAVTKTEYQGSTTRIDLALDMAATTMYLEENGGRPGASKLLVFVTDGTQTYRRLNKAKVNPIQYAVKLRQAGVRIIAIGVPDAKGEISRSELVGIVGNEKDVYTEDSFDQILEDTFLADLTAETCKREEATTAEPIVTKRKETEAPDVVTKPTAVTEPTDSKFEKLPKNEACGVDEMITDLETCFAAAKALGHLNVPTSNSWENVRKGCFEGPDGAIYFNTAGNATDNDSRTKAICKKKQAKVTTRSPSTVESQATERITEAPPCTSPCWPNSWLAGFADGMAMLGRHENVTDYKHCDQLCFAHHRCKFFTYADASKMCQMISTNLYKGTDIGFTAGKVGCSRVDDRIAKDNIANK